MGNRGFRGKREGEQGDESAKRKGLRNLENK
jgi:hypothetical protein